MKIYSLPWSKHLRRGTASKSLRDWRSTMAAYVLPELGSMHVGAVATRDVKRVLRPLALAGKHATARMVAGRIVAVLEWAEVENLREPAGSGRAIVETVMRSLSPLRTLLHQKLQPLRYLHGRSDRYRLERHLPGGNRTHWGRAPLHGALQNGG